MSHSRLLQTISFVMVCWSLIYQSPYGFSQVVLDKKAVIAAYENYARSIRSIAYTEFYQGYLDPNPDDNFTASTFERKVDFEQKVSWGRLTPDAKKTRPPFSAEGHFFVEGIIFSGQVLSASINSADQSNIRLASWLNVPDLYWERSLGPFNGIIACNHFGDSKDHYFFLPDLIAEASDVTAENGNEGLIVLKFTVRGMRFTMSIDPQKGYAMTQLDTKYIVPVEGPVAVESHYKVERFNQVSGIFFPEIVSLNSLHQAAVVKYKSPSGNEREEKYSQRMSLSKSTLSNVVINPNFSDNDFQISVPIPDYTKVSVQDARQIQYVWVDGKVKPLTDELAEERLRGVKFVPGVAEPRFWMMFVGTLMVVLAVISLIWRYYTDKNGKGKGDDDNE